MTGPEDIYQSQRDGFEISSDPARLDVDFVHGFLRSTHWAEGIPREVVERSIRYSLCFGVYHDGRQIGFGRVISDYTTFAYLADVFIVEESRGLGLSRWLVECMLQHPALQGLRKIALYTSQAHGVYAQIGFAPVSKPHNWMEIHRTGLYRSSLHAAAHS